MMVQGFPGVFYPSTRQPFVIASTYKSSTRQVTRQQPSPTRQVFVRRYCRKGFGGG